MLHLVRAYAPERLRLRLHFYPLGSNFSFYAARGDRWDTREGAEHMQWQREKKERERERD
jgi:hypothetical protein